MRCKVALLIVCFLVCAKLSYAAPHSLKINSPKTEISESESQPKSEENSERAEYLDQFLSLGQEFLEIVKSLYDSAVKGETPDFEKVRRLKYISEEVDTIVKKETNGKKATDLLEDMFTEVDKDDLRREFLQRDLITRNSTPQE